MVEVTVLPNRFRPGIGLPPSRVAQRPWLPQHARHCPVLEAGSALGCLVYPPLRLDEALQILYAHSKYQVTYFRERKPGQWDDVFQMTFSLATGGGSYNLDLAHQGRQRAADRRRGERSLHGGDPAAALRPARGRRGPARLGRLPHARRAGTPSTAPSSTRSARRVLSCLSVRVETDWYAHGTEFRYVLQPGDMFHVTATQPIGQVFFVPREEIALRDGSQEELAEFNRERDAFDQEKAADQLTAPYGLRYSPLYQKRRQGKVR